MSTSELLCTHNRDLCWLCADGRYKKVRDLEYGHLQALVPILERRVRVNSAYPSDHPRHRYLSRAEYHLKTMRAEIEWRDRNGLR